MGISALTFYQERFNKVEEDIKKEYRRKPRFRDMKKIAKLYQEKTELKNNIDKIKAKNL